MVGVVGVRERIDRCMSVLSLVRRRENFGCYRKRGMYVCWGKGKWWWVSDIFGEKERRMCASLLRIRKRWES